MTCALASSFFVSAAELNDWKFYFQSDALGMQSGFFYDKSKINRLPNGHVQVWTKVLALSDLTESKSADLTGKATKRIANGYQPPLTSIRNLSGDQVTEIVRMEEQANGPTIAPRTQQLLDIDCKEMTVNILSMPIVNGKQIAIGDFSLGWTRFSKESATATLSQLVCA